MTKTKKGAKVVPMHNNSSDTKNNAAVPETEIENVLRAQQIEIADAYREIGSLTISNRRQQQLIHDLVARLSKYESVEMAKNEDGGE